MSGIVDISSFWDPNITRNLHKVSCMKSVFPWHIVFVYLVGFSGFMCLLTRFYSPLKWLHVWFGRMYIVCMFFGMGTSLVIHNTGLPIAVLISFIYVLGGLCIGFLVIRYYMQQMDKQATQKVQEKLLENSQLLKLVSENNSDEKNDDMLYGLIQKEKAIISDQRTLTQRVFSLKTLHGTLMILSFVNIIGRIFVTPPSSFQTFSCQTYPVFKPLLNDPHIVNVPNLQFTLTNSSGASQPLSFVPDLDPDYERLPWARTGNVAWGAILFFTPVVGCFLIALAYSWALDFSKGQNPRSPVHGGESDWTTGSGEKNGVKRKAEGLSTGSVEMRQVERGLQDKENSSGNDSAKNVSTSESDRV